MEKQRAGTKIRISIGLLIFYLFTALGAFSQSYKEIRSLRVVPQNDTVYSGRDCMFKLVIPSAKPSDVQVETPVLPPGINFISMRRTDYIEKSIQAGTEIDVWLSFSSAGEQTPAPLRIRIRNRPYSVPFDAVTVLQDPSTLAPRMIILFDNGTEINNARQDPGALFTVSAGDTIRFTVYVQYAVQVMNFEWTVPKDALFTEIQRYEITEGKPRGNGFSAERIPVGRFEWQPLASGPAALPEMHFTATAYNGSRIKLMLPDMHISVLHAVRKNTVPADSDESYFAYAFTETLKTGTGKVHSAVSEADCRELASLRMKERHSLFQGRAASERRAFEKETGITDGGKEPDEPLFFLLLAGTAVLLLCTLVLFILKKRRSAAVCTAAVCALLAGTAVSGIRCAAAYGIFKGGCIHSVPDESSGCISPADSGQRVRIEEITGEWMYIQYGNTGGWISSSSVIVIR
jgi:hypothetical protein